jgi:hypothetical protein
LRHQAALVDHPNVQREHIPVLSRQDLVARLQDESIGLVLQTAVIVMAIPAALFSVA